jgi:hypothetical protein
LELPVDYTFFRILESEQPEPEPVDGFADVVLDLFDNQLCITWQAEPSRTYVIEGLPELDASWTAITSVVATSSLENYCLALPTPWQFIRVKVGEMSPQPPAGTTYVDVILQWEQESICLEWNSEPGHAYTIEARADLNSTWDAWQEVIADSTATSFCLPTSTSWRFFRIRHNGQSQPPGDEPIIQSYVDPGLSMSNGEICLVWESVQGRNYRIEGRTDLLGSEPWSSLDEVLAEGQETSFCIQGTTPYRFFRVGLLSESSNPEPSTQVRQYLDPVLERNGDELCLSWEPMEGMSYRVEMAASLVGANWIVLDTLSASSQSLVYCLGPAADFGFYRIAVVEGVDDTEQATEVPDLPSGYEPSIIDDVSLDGSTIVLQWSGDASDVFRLSRARQLVGPWLLLEQEIRSDSPEFLYQDTEALESEPGSPAFYRLEKWLLP